MKTLSLAVLLLVAPSPAQDDDPRATPLDRRMMAELRGRHGTKHARLHWDPASVTDAQRDAAAADIEAGFAKLDRIFAQRYQGTILVFLYADGADLQKRTRKDASHDASRPRAERNANADLAGASCHRE